MAPEGNQNAGQAKGEQQSISATSRCRSAFSFTQSYFGCIKASSNQCCRMQGKDNWAAVRIEESFWPATRPKSAVHFKQLWLSSWSASCSDHQIQPSTEAEETGKSLSPTSGCRSRLPTTQSGQWPCSCEAAWRRTVWEKDSQGHGLICSRPGKQIQSKALKDKTIDNRYDMWHRTLMV